MMTKIEKQTALFSLLASLLAAACGGTVDDASWDAAKIRSAITTVCDDHCEGLRMCVGVSTRELDTCQEDCRRSAAVALEVAADAGRAEAFAKCVSKKDCTGLQACFLSSTTGPTGDNGDNTFSCSAAAGEGGSSACGGFIQN